jgi:hypothetical protein
MLALTLSIPKNFQRIPSGSIEIEGSDYVTIPTSLGCKWLHAFGGCLKQGCAKSYF